VYYDYYQPPRSTGQVRDENLRFLDELSRCETAANAIYSDHSQGPWSRAQLIEDIMERAGVSRRSAAVCAEDGLISEGALFMADNFLLKRARVNSL